MKYCCVQCTPCSSCHYLQHVRVPLLCVNAMDDPLVPPTLIPFARFSPVTTTGASSVDDIGLRTGGSKGRNLRRRPSLLARTPPTWPESGDTAAPGLSDAPLQLLPSSCKNIGEHRIPRSASFGGLSESEASTHYCPPPARLSDILLPPLGTVAGSAPLIPKVRLLLSCILTRLAS